MVRHSNRFAYTPAPHFTSPAELIWKVPQPRPCNARRLSHMYRFSPIRVRSPLLTESLLFSLPEGTEMFHFPSFPPHSLCVQLRVIRHNTVRGFPIRKSWYQRPVIDSSRLIADSHVLLRLPMPRHPPCALKNLTTNMIKNLHELYVYTIERTKEHTPKRCAYQVHYHKKLLCKAKQNNQQPQRITSQFHLASQDARVHYTVPKQQPRHTHHPHHTNPQKKLTNQCEA